MRYAYAVLNRRTFVFALHFILIYALNGFAQGVPPDSRIKLFLKVFESDRNISKKISADQKSVNIAVLYNPSEKPSKTEMDEISTALEKIMGAITVQEKKLSSSYIAYRDSDTFVKELANANPSIIYVCQGLDANLAEIIKFTQDRAILSVSSSEESVAKGLSLGIVLEENRPKLIINRASMAKENIDLPASILKLAKLY